MSERDSQRTYRQACSKLFSRTASATMMATLALISGCVYGPKAERKSPLSYLNGENYESSPQGPDKMVVVMAKRKDRTTRLRGRVVRKEGLVEVPVKQARVILANGEQATVAEARTDLNGEFVLAGVIPNGRYSLSAEVVPRSGSTPSDAGGEKLSAAKLIEVNSYEMDQIILELSSPKDEHGAEQ